MNMYTPDIPDKKKENKKKDEKPFWGICLTALLLTRGRVRAIVGLFGLTVLSSCVSWWNASGYAQKVTPEHAIVSDWNHRPQLWSTVLLSAILAIAVMTPFLLLLRNGKAAAFRGLFIALPALGAYLFFVSTMIDYYGFAALFGP